MNYSTDLCTYLLIRLFHSNLYLRYNTFNFRLTVRTRKIAGAIRSLENDFYKTIALNLVVSSSLLCSAHRSNGKMKKKLAMNGRNRFLDN